MKNIKKNLHFSKFYFCKAMRNDEFDCRSCCFLNLPCGFYQILTQWADRWSNQFKNSIDVHNACIRVLWSCYVENHLWNCLNVRNNSHFIFFINFQFLLCHFILSICMILILLIVILNVLNDFWILKERFQRFWRDKIFVIVFTKRRKSPAGEKHFNCQIRIHFYFTIFNLSKAHYFGNQLNAKLNRHQLEGTT